MTTPFEIRVVEDPAAEVAALLVDVACAGGHVALRAARRRAAPTSWPRPATRT